MSGGLKVGDLYVLLSAKTSAFGKGMQDAAKVAEKVAKKIKQAANEIGRAGAMIGAGIAAALAVAAEHNKAVAAETDRTKAIFGTFANEIAMMMLPALQRMNELLRELLGWWQALSPETKAQIAHWVEVATVVGLTALAIGKISGLVAALMPAFQALGGVIAIGFAPLTLAIAGIVALVVAVALLHKAWRTNWNGIREKTASVVDAISGYWQSFKTWLSTSFFDWFIDRWADVEKALRHAGNYLLNPINDKARDQANATSDRTIDDWAKRMKAGAMGDALKLVADKLEEGADVVIDELGLIGDEIKAAFKKALGWTGQAGVVDNPADPKLAAFLKKGMIGGLKGGAGEAADFYKRADVLREGFGSMKKLGEDDEQGRTTDAVAQAYAKEVRIREFWNDQIDKLGNGLMAGAQQFISKLGDFGQVVNAGIQGFQSGGIWGAFIAVIVELLSKFERFQELIDIGNGLVQNALKDLAGSFNDLIDGLKPLLGAVGMILHVVHGILAPIISFIGKLLGGLAPILALISVVIEPIARSLETLFDIIGDTLGPVFEILGKVLTGIALAFMALNEPLLYLKAGFLELAKWIEHTFDPTKNHTGIDTAVEKAWADIHANEKKMQDIVEHGLGGLASNAAEAAGAVGRLGDTADTVSRQLTNIPSGFNTALAEWQASWAVSSSANLGGSERDSFRQTGNATKSSSSSYHRGKDRSASSDL